MLSRGRTQPSDVCGPGRLRVSVVLPLTSDFRRLWTFYLSSSEAGFRERRIADVQTLFAKPGWR